MVYFVVQMCRICFAVGGFAGTMIAGVEVSKVHRLTLLRGTSNALLPFVGTSFNLGFLKMFL